MTARFVDGRKHKKLYSPSHPILSPKPTEDSSAAIAINHHSIPIPTTTTSAHATSNIIIGCQHAKMAVLPISISAYMYTHC